MITSSMIKDLQPIRIPYSRKVFYLWLVARFGYRKAIEYEDCKEYGVSRRTLFRYFGDLVDEGMIYKEPAKRGSKTRLYLDREYFIKRENKNLKVAS